MILLIDNYDSFVYNLARYVAELGQTPVVHRHDALTLEGIAALAPSHIIISPGPCSPTEAGISCDVIRHFGPTIPTLGVCLGHQCIGAVYGGEVVRARRPMHGKTSSISHSGRSIFTGLPSPLIATRYHSLVIAPESVPESLEVLATADDGEIMAVAHRQHPVVGVQFHPESVLTEYGYRMLDWFLTGGRGRDVPDRADGATRSPLPSEAGLHEAPPSSELVR